MGEPACLEETGGLRMGLEKQLVTLRGREPARVGDAPRAHFAQLVRKLLNARDSWHTRGSGICSRGSGHAGEMKLVHGHTEGIH
jgi:hypothetical protein